ncbi:S1 RNA-binding domain-containing protein 1 [Onthophagus taurus]|uniref:S1 RNA-binding domain-containing protein 1 n=1 Tax=Onthophagus taurus TaxID=166361 RepID=UPI0039BE27DD
MNKTTKIKNAYPPKRKREEKDCDSEDSPKIKKSKTSLKITTKAKNEEGKLSKISKNIKEIKTQKIKIATKENQINDNYWKDYELVAERQSLDISVANNIIDMFNDGCTIPFIARYRKHVTNNMTPETLREIKQCYEEITTVKLKSQTVLKSLRAGNHLQPVLQDAVLSAKTLEELEHIYAPYKVTSKKTYYDRAKKLGLEDPAIKLLTTNLEVDLKSYVNKKNKDLDTYEKVEEGCIHVIAHIIGTKVDVLNYIRELRVNGNFTIEVRKKKSTSKTDEKKSNENEKFEHYYEFNSCSKYIKPHQILAINRGEQNKILSMKILVPDYITNKFNKCCWDIFGQYITSSSVKKTIFKKALNDCYKRLIQPLLIREVRLELKTVASKASLNVFCDNLKELLLMKSVKGSVIAGIDPGFTHGCKLGIIGIDGSLLDFCTLFPFKGQTGHKEESKLKDLLVKHSCSLIALGNGTGCRETEAWLSKLIERNFFNPLNIQYTIVNENGASIYSCSNEAKKEFPNLDPNIISAVSIARRVQDPLAEYVKVDPKHIGVGMYQHDLSKKLLDNALEEVISECVSFVGVDVNTCSDCLLKRVSGLSEKKAQLILDYRKENGPFINRKQITEIKGIGPKCFEQCAGFLKVAPLSEKDRKSFYKNPKTNHLDMTIIHPESYKITIDLLNKYKLKLNDIGTENFIKQIEDIKKDFKYFDLAQDYKTSEHTLRLILEALSKRFDYDMRDETAKVPFFKKGLTSINDLQTGLVLKGRVINNTHFGAFIDIGVESRALLHCTKLNGEKVGIGDILEVKVIFVNVSSRKINLELIRKVV